MSNIDIIRAWKDEEYRNSLTEEQRSQLPENPAGIVELSDEDMEALAGGYLNAAVGLQPAGQTPVMACSSLPPRCQQPNTRVCGILPTYPSFPSIGSRFPFRY